MEESTSAVTTHKIGKVTYFVSAAPSETASDTLGKKIEKMIMKDLQTAAYCPVPTPQVNN